MSITLYARYRRQNLRRAWQFAGMWRWTSQAIVLIASIIFLLIGMLWIDNQLARADEAKQQAIQANHKATKLEETWVSCLENKGVWINDALHVCSVINAQLAKGDFHERD